MSNAHDVYRRWIHELWTGKPIASERVAGRWSGRGKTGDSLTVFFGNDILRFADGRFVEYWTGTSTG